MQLYGNLTFEDRPPPEEMESNMQNTQSNIESNTKSNRRCRSYLKWNMLKSMSVRGQAGENPHTFVSINCEVVVGGGSEVITLVQISISLSGS